MGSQPVKPQFGFPWEGYNGVQAGHLAEEKQMAKDSTNWFLSNQEGKLIRRAGTALYEDNLAEINYDGGANERYRFRGEQILPIRTEAIRASGNVSPQTVGVLFTDEDTDTFTAQAYAFLYYEDYVTPFIRRIADQITNYYVPDGAPSSTQAVLPTNDIGGPRFLTTTDRAKHAMGSRQCLQVGEWVFFPTYGNRRFLTEDGLPHCWNGVHPTGYSSWKRIERIRPTGNMPPIWSPRIVKVGVGGNWPANSKFYAAYMYEYDDGSFSRPSLIRPVAAVPLASGSTRYNGTANLGGVGYYDLGAGTCDTITWQNVPVGPSNVKYVWMLRSKIVISGVPDPLTLGLVNKVENGRTTYSDGAATDSANFPVVDDTIINFRDVWPSRARTMWEFDQRIAIGDLRQNPAAICITLGGVTQGALENNDSDNNLYSNSSTHRGYVRVMQEAAGAGNDLPNISLYLFAEIVSTNSYVRRIDLAGGLTLQGLCDEINGHRFAETGPVLGDTTRLWHAQLAPGADGGALAINLAQTSTTANAYGDVYTKRGTHSQGGLTTPEAGAATDNTVIRTYGASMPVVLRFSSTYLSAQRDRPSAVQFTRSGPGLPPNAANSYDIENYREGPASVGRCMGGIGLLDGSLVLFERGIGVLRNIRDGKTGLDEDYRLEIVWWNRGCISTHVGRGPGFGVYLTPLGLVANDGREELNLSETLFDPGRKTGDLAYEISQCILATTKNNHSDYFECYVSDDSIWISYRSSASVTRPDRWLRMDFSPGKDLSGLAALINPRTGKPWGWSTPYKPMDASGDAAKELSQGTIAPSAMGMARGAREPQTMRFFGTRDRHNSGVKSGHLWELETGHQDNAATAITPEAFTKIMVVADGSTRLFPEAIYVRYKKDGDGLTVKFADDTFSHPADGSFTAKALATSGSDDWGEKLWQLPLTERSLMKGCEIKIVDDGTTTSKPEVWGIELRARVVDWYY